VTTATGSTFSDADERIAPVLGDAVELFAAAVAPVGFDMLGPGEVHRMELARTPSRRTTTV